MWGCYGPILKADFFNIRIPFEPPPSHQQKMPLPYPASNTNHQDWEQKNMEKQQRVVIKAPILDLDSLGSNLHPKIAHSPGTVA